MLPWLRLPLNILLQKSATVIQSSDSEIFSFISQIFFRGNPLKMISAPIIEERHSAAPLINCPGHHWTVTCHQSGDQMSRVSSVQPPQIALIVKYNFANKHCIDIQFQWPKAFKQGEVSQLQNGRMNSSLFHEIPNFILFFTKNFLKECKI